MLIKETAFLRAFGFLKIPMLFFISPTVQRLDREVCIVKVPLNFRTKNHLGSMYFGVLSAGADIAGGLIAMKMIHEGGNKISLVFKDFNAKFFKRAEGHVFFTCTQGLDIQNLVQKALDGDERVEMPVDIVATVPSKTGDEPVAQFTLTLSLKKKKAKAD